MPTSPSAAERWLAYREVFFVHSSHRELLEALARHLAQLPPPPS